jgi:hypothetical protein
MRIASNLCCVMDSISKLFVRKTSTTTQTAAVKLQTLKDNIQTSSAVVTPNPRNPTYQACIDAYPGISLAKHRVAAAQPRITPETLGVHLLNRRSPDLTGLIDNDCDREDEDISLDLDSRL